MAKDIIIPKMKIKAVVILFVAVIVFFLTIPKISNLIERYTSNKYYGKMAKQTGFYYEDGYYKVDLKYKKMFIDVNAPYYEEVVELNKNLK